MARPAGLLLVDVSDYQKPSEVPWSDSRIAGGYVKLSEGVTAEKYSNAHVKSMTLAGKPFGGYHFFIPTDDPQLQWQTFAKQATAVGYGQGDLIPALDIERCITRGKWQEADKSWCPTIAALVALMVGGFGDVEIYCGWATFIQLGAPSWMIKHRLWVPFVSVPGQAPPASCRKSPAGKPADIWQFMWGPLFGALEEPSSPVAIDQSVCQQLPPFIAALNSGAQS